MSAPNFARPLLRAALLLLCALTVWSAQAAQLDFSSGDWPGGIAQSGEGGSFSPAGLSLQIMNTDVDGGPAIGAMYHRTDAFFGSGNSNFSALTHDQDGPGRLDMVIKSSNGRPFSLKSFVYLNWGEDYNTQVQVRGYRAGAPAAGATHSFPWAAYQPITIMLPASFDNVDEVRIRMLPGNTVNTNLRSWHAINNLVVDVPNSAPSDIALSANTVLQSSAANTTVGTLTSTDPDIGSTFAYSLAAGAGSTDNASFTIAGNTLRANTPAALAAGNRSIRVRTTDENGAVFEKTLAIVVTDDLAPTVSSTAPSGSPAATATSVSFAVTFSEAVSGVSIDDFTLVSTGNATGNFAAVSGSGAVYSVDVTGITGNGTLKLNVNGSTNIVDAAGNVATAYSSGTTHSVAIPTAPDAPTIGTAAAANGQATISFTAPAYTGGSAITSYTVTSSPGNMIGTGTASPILVTGLSNGTAYTFTVTATNAVGTSVASSASNAVTPKGPQTITFTNPGTQNFGTAPALTATSSSALPVTFSSSTSPVCMITSGGTLTFLTSGSCTINADQAGDGTYDSATTVSQTFTVAAVTPGAPTIGTATAGNSQASVTFAAPASNGGSSITAYTVTSNPGGLTGTGAGSPITVTGLTNGIGYTFTVTATNSAGTGSASAASNSVTPASPQTITFVNPGAQTYGTSPTLTATSSSSLAVNFTSSTTAVCTISSGGQLSFVTAGTCTINANQAGDSTYLPATQVSQSFTVNAVVPGAPTSVSASPSGTGQISVTFAAPASTGGSAITGYTVTAAPGGATGTGAGSPITVSGLTVGQSYTFTVTATNSAGTGSASAASNAAVAADAIVASPSSATVAYDTATAVALTISGIPTSVVIIGNPAHGQTAVSGTTVTYTPTTGYYGADSFSYQASDGNTTSATATVSITVSPPTLVATPATLAAATAGTAYTPTLSTSGGAAPYSYQVIGTLPPGLALSSTGVFSGAPTTANTYSFSVRVTDSSTGNGPSSKDTAYTLVVNAPQLAFALSNLPQSSTATGYTQRLQVSGGAAPYSFAVSAGALPTGLALGSDGVFSGTPQGTGSYAFTVTVTDANGFTASQAYTLQVLEAMQQISAFMANPTAPVYSENGRFSVSASGGASGNAIVFATTTPAVCRVEGGSVTMLAAGRCSLTANQAGNTQYLAATQVTLEVDITAAVPVLQWPQELQKMYGEAAFDLIDPQSPSRGAFSYSSSDATVASVQGRTVTLVGEGVTILTVTQAASGGYAVGTAQLRLVVSQRPDPTRDPGVVAGLQAQVDASVRFASAQQSNIRDRLRQVRGGSNASSNQLSLSYAGGNDLPNVSVPMSRLGGDALPALPAGWGLWASGSASYGAGPGGSSRYDFRTDGLTIGVDRAFGNRFLFGVAGSVGHNNSDMDDNDARVKSDQRSLAAYGLWRGGEHVFVDGIVATGTLDFDTRRWSADADAFAQGKRDGDQWFGSLAFGYEHRHAGTTLTGYGRVEASRSTLDSYRESGAGLYDLVYRQQVVRNSAVALGLEGAYLSPDPEARVRPFWSIEYRQALDDKGDAYLNYAIGPRAQDYQLRMQSYNDHALSIAAGMDVRLQRGWFMSLLLGHEQTRGSSRATSIGLRLGYGAAGGASGTGTLGSAEGTGKQRCNPRRCPPQATAAPR
ncbi:autotransporter domain-containing protein [Stenotrophomonas sp. TEPEL]|uniref:autotransporter domain-containing protein n=1 Tax=Stenotrophomonas sp. TEPEL TaxID=2283801 RepID=UPI001044FEAA|nr:autotransporter domain-containing protein [Stenotrophomonas sp. TEPEL]TDB33013.1 autotransporter domain-containing protein [Stenotrophomonas sp. TEPEL]